MKESEGSLIGFLGVVCILLSILLFLHISVNSDFKKNVLKNCLTYHQELPYYEAIETCEVILKGKGDKK